MGEVKSRAEGAKEWCAVTFGLNALLELAEGVLSVEGTLWTIARAAVSVVFTVALILWIVFAYRERRGREWIVPVLLAAGLAGALTLFAILLD